MNLIQIKQKIQDAEQEYNQLLGQKSMLVESLKKLGFNSLEAAKKEKKKMKLKLQKMEKYYDAGVDKFKKQYEHLL